MVSLFVEEKVRFKKFTLIFSPAQKSQGEKKNTPLR